MLSKMKLMTARRLTGNVFFIIIEESFFYKIQRGLGNSRIVLFLRTMSPERRDLYSLRPDRHRGLSRTIYKGEGGACCINVFIDLPLSRRGHRLKKLIKLYKTVIKVKWL